MIQVRIGIPIKKIVGWRDILKHFSNQRGSTLIEILVSMLIMSITMLGGIALYFNASELQKMAIHRKMATEIAGSKMEKLRTMTCMDIGLLDHEWDDLQLGGLFISKADSKGIKIPLPIIVTPSDVDKPKYCQVEVQIKWNEVGQINRDFDFKLITYVAP